MTAEFILASLTFNWCSSPTSAPAPIRGMAGRRSPEEQYKLVIRRYCALVVEVGDILHEVHNQLVSDPQLLALHTPAGLHKVRTACLAQSLPFMNTQPMISSLDDVFHHRRCGSN